MSETTRKKKDGQEKSHKEQRTDREQASGTDAQPPTDRKHQNFDDRREEPTREDFKKTS